MLRGTFRKDRDRPSSTMGVPVKIDEVGQRCQVSGLKSCTRRASAIYWSLVKRVAALGMLEEAFCPQLLLYAMDYDLLLTLAENIRHNGPIIKQGKKTTRTRTYQDGSTEVTEIDERLDLPNPAVKQFTQLQDKILKIGSNFGFSPIDRSRLKVPAEEGKDLKLKGIIAAFAVQDDEPDADEQ